ncbi:MAG: GatB/YqeY domain-containing protein [Bacteroidetes bacterium]|nr:GatB/YqeY domain-containing protein [Bacteroidota bacterium]
MSLEQQINDDIKSAMLAKDKRKLEALRAVKAAILLAKTDKGSAGGIETDAEMKILQKLVKQRRESADIYKQQNRADLVEEEEFQLLVISKYLPEQLSEEDVRKIIKETIAETGATSIKEMGKVMGAATKKLAGKADNRMISAIIKELLGDNDFAFGL